MKDKRIMSSVVRAFRHIIIETVLIAVLKGAILNLPAMSVLIEINKRLLLFTAPSAACFTRVNYRQK